MLLYCGTWDCERSHLQKVWEKDTVRFTCLWFGIAIFCSTLRTDMTVLLFHFTCVLWLLSSCSCPQLPELPETNISEWIQIPTKRWLWLCLEAQVSLWNRWLWSRCSDGSQVRSMIYVVHVGNFADHFQIFCEKFVMYICMWQVHLTCGI